ncbi:MAG TPA: sulfatase-like hydrolase/transferase [Polyangiaceae bacterium]|jgi:hypothetical protein|nr:MAG: Arylsulfatase [Deltaproteobacteria bacterium ADurb.Bin207]HNZ23549.1 sulfatase-like hydrolase/transferase [Polyangiaceae bacterium]HOD24215.1 sulfatase-like hydrolase/transferase [Polyangiaceae bacterium]HOE51451.1 sulfatase-like hydrolase/transferase [Polyangiaceae bacterium]HOH01321.1 sulfatase-like hydrolase/transferase [Polyangiaceae bacterium]
MFGTLETLFFSAIITEPTQRLGARMSANTQAKEETPRIGWRWLRVAARPQTAHAMAWLLAGALVGICFALVDGLARFVALGANPGGWTWRMHAIATSSLYLSLGIVFGLALGLLKQIEFATRFLLSAWSAFRLPTVIAAILIPCVTEAAAGLWIWTARSAPPSDLVDWIALCLAITAAATISAIGPALGTALLNRKRRKWIAALVLAVAGSVLAWIDLTAFVSLYPFLHALLEAATTVLWLLSFYLLLETYVARSKYFLFFAAACAIVAVGFIAFHGPSWSARHLRHTATHHVYVGRLLARTHHLPTLSTHTIRRQPVAEAAQRSMSRQDERPADACPSLWWPKEAPATSVSLRAEMPEAPNIVVVFVDTLRADIAHDPRIMPNLSRFSRASLQFTRAYSTGSDTRSCLPAMVRGSYDLDRDDEYDPIYLARANGIPTGLAIASSPREFLAKHVPQFRFDEVLEVPDYDDDKKVWGYGAHRFTAERLVDESIAWIESKPNKRFLLWQFHFDLHAWRELDPKELANQARSLGVPKLRGEWNRYAAAAATIDAAFGRFLRELERLDVRKNTVIIFLADHGEGMGRQGFWLHSVFLWESLVRVPLVVHLPGIEGRKIDSYVSTVDVGPMLARLIDPNASLFPYHGEDLLTQIGPEPASRRFPMLMRAVLKEQVVRVGVIDPTINRKLILPLESGTPELYDLSVTDPDEMDKALEETATVEKLLPIVNDGPMNPRARRKHDRCLRSLSEPDQDDSLATEGRRMKRAKTGGPT